MANDGQPALYARMELRVRDAEKQLEKFIRRADQGLSKFDRRAQQSAARAEAAFSGMFASFGKGLLGGLAGAFSVQAAQQFLDSATRIKNALRQTGVEGKAATAIYDRLFTSAQKNAAPIESLVDLYSRATLVQGELGASSEDLIGFTDGVAVALRASGKSASEASGALTQLSQLLGAGTVRAEEFNSVQEGALPILKAVAAGMSKTGGSVARLRQLVVDGKVSSKEFFEAFQRGRGILDSMVAGSRLTIDQGFQRLRNTLTYVAGALDDVTGASGRVGEGLAGVSEIIKNLSDVITGFSGSPATQFIAKLDEMVSRFEPLRRGLAILATPGLGEKLVQAMTPQQRAALDDARSELEGQFRRLPRALAADKVSRAQFDALNRLKQQLRDNTITADGARKAVASIFGDNPGTDKFKSDLDAAIAKIEELTAASENVKAASKLDAGEFQRESNRGAAFSRIRETADTREALTQRLLDAQRSELEQEIDARAKQIVEQFGDKITEEVAKIQARAEIALERDARASDSASSAALELIRRFEGFRTDPYWDKNHLRVGFGSDTVTEADGTVREVVAGMKVTVDDAIRDASRRIDGYFDEISRKIGPEAFGALNEDQKAVLASIVHNYGELPDRLVAALKGGDAGSVYEAIKRLGGDNDGINRGRRAEEAQMFLQGAPEGVTKRVEAQENFAKTLKDQRTYLDGLLAETQIRANLNPLIDDNGKALTTLEAAQYLLTEAQQQGIEAGKELKDVQQLLYGDLSNLSPAARDQALAMRALAEETGNAEAASKRLDDSQDRLQGRLTESANFGKDVFGGFIRDMLNGKSAADALNDALGKIGDRLLEIGLNYLFFGNGAGTGMGGGIFGSLFSWLFPFAEGGVARAGKPVPLKKYAGGGVSKTAAIFGETGKPEAAVPLPDGRTIPVTLKGPLTMPDLTARRAGRGTTDVVHVVLQDDSGRMAGIADQRIKTASGPIVQVSVAESRKQVVPTMARYQAQSAGGDYRNGG